MSTDFPGSGAGIDASSGGWFGTVIDEDGTVDQYFEESFESIVVKIGEIEPVLVDVPIGLPTEDRRSCDIKTKTLLGCRGLSVFYPPSTDAIDIEPYEKANQAHRDAIGHGLSQQAYHIGSAIRQVRDELDGEIDGRIRESHPELCFLALNGQPVAWPKSTKHGQQFRLELLGRVIGTAEQLYNDALETYLRRKVSRDDILDSMVLAWAATQPELATVPADVEPHDPRIYYPEPTELAVPVDELV